jgi:plastocyanin
VSPRVSRTPRLGAVAAATLAALLLAACGNAASDDGMGVADGGSAQSPTYPGAGWGLTVEAHDIEFDGDAYRIATGPVDIEYRQEGTLPHSLVIEQPGGITVDGFRLEVGDAEADRGTVDLPPGDYVFYCDVPGHRDAGMEAELHVG